MNELSVDVLKKLLPKKFSSNITDDVIKKLNEHIKDPIVAEQVNDNFLSYIDVLKEGKFSLEEYINAVKFVSYKLADYSSTEAFIATFPKRYKELINKGSDNLVYNYASMYNKTKLVNLIFERTLIPVYILNAPLHQEALNTLAGMIRDDNVRGLVKVKACETILNYTKKPEVVKGELNINVNQSSVIDELREVTEKLADTLRSNLESGTTSLTDVAELEILDAEVIGDSNE